MTENHELWSALARYITITQIFLTHKERDRPNRLDCIVANAWTGTITFENASVDTDLQRSVNDLDLYM